MLMVRESVRRKMKRKERKKSGSNKKKIKKKSHNLFILEILCENGRKQSL